MKMFNRDKVKKFMTVLLAVIVSVTFTSSSTTGFGRVLAAEDDLQYYDNGKSIKIDLEDNDEELGSIWFDGENYYDHNPDDEVGIEYPSGEWTANKEIEGTDYSVTVNIPAGAFDRRVGFYAQVVGAESLTDAQKSVLEQNKLVTDKLEFFDIGFKDNSGNEIEPSKAINISIRMKNRASKAKEEGDSLFMDIYHITEAGGTSLDKVASIDEKSHNTDDENNENSSENSEGIVVEGDDVVASFRADSFSLFVLNDGSGNFTITYDNNEDYLISKFLITTPGTITGDMNTPVHIVTPGSMVTLKENSYVWADHLFRGWSNVPDPNDPTSFPTGITEAVTYTDAVSVAVTENMTLYAQWTDHVHDASWTPINADADGKFNPATLTPGKYYLATDVKFTQKWLVPAGEFTLCLNGHKLSGELITTDRIIEVGQDAILNIEDCNGDTSNQPYIVKDPIDNSDVEINSGLITGGILNGAIFIKYGTMNFYGGTIAGNIDTNTNGSSLGGGGGILLDIGQDPPAGASRGVLNVYGGSISYNNATAWGGGGIRGQGNSDINIYGGLIHRNLAAFAAISARLDTNVTVYGGVISDNVGTDNRSNQGGGGIHTGGDFSGIIDLEGGIIENNEARNNRGGGVFSSSPSGKFVFSNVIIRNNKSKDSGGALGVTNDNQIGSIKMHGTPYIYGNSRFDGTVDNIAVPKNITIEVTGPLKDEGGNKAKVGINSSRSVPYTFTSDYGYSATNGYNFDIDPEDYFISDNPNYRVVVSRDNNEAMVKAAHKHALIHTAATGKLVYEKWESANSLPTTAGSWYLTKDVILSSTWTPPTGTTNLCLNGHIITSAGMSISQDRVVSGTPSLQQLIQINNPNINLSITDCNESHYVNKFNSPTTNEQIAVNTGLIIGATYHGILINRGTCNFYEATIAGIHCTDNDNDNNRGAGVRVAVASSDDGVFNMYSGRICHCKANALGGGAIAVRFNGTCNVVDGELDHCSGGNGGAILATDTSYLYIRDGRFHHNNCFSTVHAGPSGCEGGGGAICIGSTHNALGRLEITGGTFTDNESVTQGGAITVDQKGGRTTDIVIGSIVVENNKAGKRGGGVSISTGNTTVKLQGEPIVQENTCNNKTENLYLTDGKKLKITGKLSEDTNVGISMESPGVFTTDYGYSDGYNDDVDPSAYFFSDNENYDVLLHNRAEGKLGGAHKHNLYGVHSSDEIRFERWPYADRLPTDAGEYYLSQDVTLNDTWTCAEDITICLNGHQIKKSNGDIVYLTAGTLTVCDDEIYETDENERTHTITNQYTGSGTVDIHGGLIGGTNSGRSVHLERGSGTFKLYGGTLGGNRGCGIRIRVASARAELYGGEIAYNNQTEAGGGVHSTSGIVEMYSEDGHPGCDIHHNVSSGGGGIHITGAGQLLVDGGRIYQNKATHAGNNDSGGGGVNTGTGFEGSAIFSGGSIFNNECAGYGGGIRIGSGDNIIISGTRIYDNRAFYGGGLILINRPSSTHIIPKVVFNKGSFDDDESIAETKGNTASEGGAIYMETGTTLIMQDNDEDGSSPVISGNTATSTAGGIYVSKGAKLSLSGSPTVMNNAVQTASDAVRLENNIYLPKDDGTTADKKYNITIAGPLENSTEDKPLIGVTKEPKDNEYKVRFTTGYGYSAASAKNEDNVNSTAFHYDASEGGIDPAKYFFSDVHVNYEKNHALSPTGDWKVKPYVDDVEAMLFLGYAVEYHAPTSAGGFTVNSTQPGAIWNDTYRENAATPDSVYSKTDIDTPNAETFFIEAVEPSSEAIPATDTTPAVPAKTARATEPIDPTWNPETGFVFSGWCVAAEDGTTTNTEYAFGKKVKKDIVLNATWEQVEDKQSYVGGLVGYTEEDIIFTDCQVGSKPADAAAEVGVLIRSEAFDGYAGGFLGYGKKAVASAGTSKANVRLFGTVLGGICGSQDEGQALTIGAGTTTEGFVIGRENPNDSTDKSYIPYRLVAGEYIGRPLTDAENSAMPAHTQSQGTGDHTFRFYDITELTSGVSESTKITSVVRPNHRFYQPKLIIPDGKELIDVDPLCIAGTLETESGD